jgi:SAM-dependent methyltransferase
VLDAAPTGHFLRLVEAPELALAWTRELLRVTHRYRSSLGLDAFAERPLRCLDVACGNGAVVDFCLSALGRNHCEITCVDVSEGAIASITRRFPDVVGLVTDATSIPLDSASFDFVTSQFGVEYAGTGAVAEAARLLSPGGRLGFLLHHSEGSIYGECAKSLAAIRATQDAQFIPLAVRLFETGFAACSGGDRASYDAAGVALSPAVKAVEQILDEHGHGVADDTIRRLYCDVGDIHNSIQNYTPDEVIEWLQRMDMELEAFAGRMASMCVAAMDESDIRAVTKGLVDNGLVVEGASTIGLPGDRPLAWSVIAYRQ